MTNTLTHFLIIDSSRIDNLLQVIYEKIPQPNFGYLYDKTPYDHVKKIGPLWVEIELNSEIWQHWFSSPLWSSSGIIVSINESSFDAVLSQLRSRIEVLSPTDNPLYFRFHSPYTLQRFMSSLDNSEKNEFWGNINQVHWLVPDESYKIWTQMDYINLNPKNTSAQKFRFSDKTLQGLQI